MNIRYLWYSLKFKLGIGGLSNKQVAAWNASGVYGEILTKKELQKHFKQAGEDFGKDFKIRNEEQNDT